jgi:cell division protein FtsZ
MSLVEVNEASSIIHGEADSEANIIFGAVVDPRMQGRMKITVIATGFHRPANAKKAPSVTPVDIANYKRPTEMAVGSEGFYRKGSDGLSMDLDFAGLDHEGGEDLDVPTFLRKGKA